MTGDLPAPPTPSDADLSDFAFTPIFRARLFGSRFHARVSDAEWRAGVTLWLKSWDQVPAGSLPDDDIDLCRLAELGRDLKLWRKIRAGALHGWFKCSDGLLYHRVVAEGVNDALERKRRQSNRGVKGAQARWNKQPDAMQEAPVADASSTRPKCHRHNSDVAEAPPDDPSAMPEAMLGDGNRQGQGQGQGKEEKKEISLPSEARPLAAPDDAETEVSRAEVEQAFAAWNALAGQTGLPRAHRLDDERRKRIAVRLRENGGLAGWRRALAAIRASPFLLGQERLRDGERSWNATLDWLLKPSNFRKVAEGNYTAKAPAMSRSEEAARAIYEALVPNGTPPPHACDPDAITLQPSEWISHEP